jgi:hypothetical protein
MHPIKNELELAWKALSDEQIHSGWRSIEIARFGSSILRAARYYPDNTEAILIGFETIEIGSSISLPSCKGFSMERMKSHSNNEKTVWLSLVRDTDGLLEFFSVMVDDVLNTLIHLNSSDERQIYQTFLGRIKAWQEFMKKGSGILTPESELGLIGELYFMKLLLDFPVSINDILSCWAGPEDGLQDFLLGHGAVEIKSTLSSNYFPAKIASLEQLDDSFIKPMYLGAVRLELSNDGYLLSDVVNQIKNAISIDPYAKLKFENLLLHAGYSTLNEHDYTRKFSLVDIYLIEVNSDFPRLTYGNVHAGVKNARYDIELQGYLDKATPLTEVIKRLGVI